MDGRLSKIESDVKTYTDLRNRMVELFFLSGLIGLNIVFLKFVGVVP